MSKHLNQILISGELLRGENDKLAPKKKTTKNGKDFVSFSLRVDTGRTFKDSNGNSFKKYENFFGITSFDPKDVEPIVNAPEFTFISVKAHQETSKKDDKFYTNIIAEEVTIESADKPIEDTDVPF